MPVRLLVSARATTRVSVIILAFSSACGFMLITLFKRIILFNSGCLYARRAWVTSNKLREHTFMSLKRKFLLIEHNN